MDCSTSGFTVLCHLLEFAQIHLHWVSDDFQPCCPLSSLLLLPSVFPNIRVFSNELVFTSDGQSIGVSASVLPMNIQDWFPIWLTGLISLQSKELSRIYSNTTVQKHQFFGTQLSLRSNSHIHISLSIRTFVSRLMSLLFNMLSTLVIAFLPRSKHLLISFSHHLQWFWSPRK